MNEVILKRQNPFSIPGKWFKGAIHFHTNLSDGKISPENAITFFKKNNYDFICCGDHWRVTTPIDPDGKILVIPGCELDTWTDDTPGNTHIMCVGVADGIKGELRPKDWNNHRATHLEIWETAKKISEYQILAHPYWSTRSPEFIKNYTGIGAIEVYNHGFEVSHAMGYSEYAWHMLLNEGFYVDAMAVDDAHGNDESFGHGWLMVKAEKCTYKMIIQALKNGNFYSTTGPEIKSVVFEDGKIHVTTSPVKRIIFRSTQFFGNIVTAELNNAITEADSKIELKEMELIRIEVEDHQGRKAWSNPFYFANSMVSIPGYKRFIHF